MNKIRDILNEIKWKEETDFSDVEIWYIHRGAVQNTRVLKGSDIIGVHKTFIETSDAMIPHHRIFRIIYKNTIVFERHQTV